jgi:hypothetical protein
MAMTNPPFTRPATGFMFLIAIIAWLALSLQQYILLANTPGNGLTVLGAIGRFFLFFTVLTNLLVAIGLTIILVRPQSRWGVYFSRPATLTATAVYILIVGLVYNIILRPLWAPTGLQRVADELLHVVVPVLFLIFWLVFVTKGHLKWRNVFGWLLYPALYFAYSLLRGALSGFYAYPFIDVSKLGSTEVAINAAAILLSFIVIGLFFVFIDNRLGRVNRQERH